MTYHFDKYLDKNRIESIAAKFGFTVPAYIEKFIMDFEINYHISQQIESTVRGGMCIPFHTELGLRRLSIDIDLLTRLSNEKIQQIMATINNELSEVQITKHIPKDGYPIPNLLSYYVEYTSCIGNNKKETVKVDFLCNMEVKLPVIEMKDKKEILEFQLDYPATILSLGALIGDKITTLALNTIGLKKKKYYDIPKQIYDIATLLKIASVQDIKESLQVFQIFTTFKIKIFNNGIYDIKTIVQSIFQSIEQLFSFSSTLTTNDDYDGLFGSFTGTYLGNQAYRKTIHISDMLLVWAYSKSLLQLIVENITIENCSQQIFDSTSEFKEISSHDADEKVLDRIKILENMPQLSFNKNILNGPPVEQVYLIKKIYSDQR